MKKIYITLLSGLFISQFMTAQTLTKAANEPIVGDMNLFKGFDSVGVVPKNGGTGQSWNFSSFIQNTVTASSTYTTPASVASSSAFAGVTIVENQGGGDYNYFKSTSTPTTQYEILGMSSVANGITFNYTNSAVAAIWPVSFGYTNTDNFSGTISGALSGTLDGTVTSNATGTGTITMPGGQVLSNVLQVKIVNTVTLNVSGGLITGTVAGTDYEYYHSSQKFPLLKVAYSKQTLSSFGGPTVTTTADISANGAIITGLNDKNFDATFQIFPNPAKDAFNVNLTNTSGETGVVYIYNAVGQLVKRVELGNNSVLSQNISLSDLTSGIYIVKTSLGEKSSSRKLVVE